MIKQITNSASEYGDEDEREAELEDGHHRHGYAAGQFARTRTWVTTRPRYTTVIRHSMRALE